MGLLLSPFYSSNRWVLLGSYPLGTWVLAMNETHSLPSPRLTKLWVQTGQQAGAGL